MILSSPRTWGCFPFDTRSLEYRPVFPTHVGVFLIMARRAPAPPCLPHARGGVSIAREANCVVAKSSPRTWGCFCPGVINLGLRQVFPTHVGVFPPIRKFCKTLASLPHAR